MKLVLIIFMTTRFVFQWILPTTYLVTYNTIYIHTFIPENDASNVE